MVRKVLEACPVNIQMTRAARRQAALPQSRHRRAARRSHQRARLLRQPDGPDAICRAADARRVGRRFRNAAHAQGRRSPAGARSPSRLIDFHGEKVIVSHTYDLSDRIEMQQQLEHQRETLHQNEKMSALGGLLAGVAHELNNPLSVVLGLSLMMKESAADAKAAERADKISKAAERCARIVKTFLAMARQQPARTSNVTIDEIIAAARRGGRLFHPLVRYRARRLTLSRTFRRSGPIPISSARSGSISWSMPSTRCTTGKARRKITRLDRAPSKERQHRRSRRRHRAGNLQRKSCHASSSLSSPRRRSAREPGSACRSAIASCNRMAGPSRSKPAEGGGSVFVVTLPASRPARRA